MAMSKRKSPKSPAKLDNSDTPKPQVSAPSRPGSGERKSSSSSALVLTITLALILAGTSYLYSTRYNGEFRDTSSLTHLPESYALCTHESGNVYTVTGGEGNGTADCLLVRKDRILGTGTLDAVRQQWDVLQNELIRKFYGNEPKAKKPLQVLHSKPGTIIIPGLADSHAHLTGYGFKVQLELDGAHTIEDVLDTIEEYVRAHPEVSNPDSTLWVQGMGWDQTRWFGWRGGFPSASDLASRPLLSNLPISLSRVDGHALWVSPRALELTLKSLPDQKWPADGEVVGGEIRRGDDGQPTGVFIDNAMDLVAAPQPTDEQMEEWAKLAMKDALAVGLTSVHDASSMEQGMVDVFKRLAEDGELPIRVYAMASPDLPIDIPQLHQYGIDGRLDMRSIKIMTDGALGSWGAALLEPYSDDPTTSGIMRYEEETLSKLVQKWWEAGWGINIHCIGDRANKVVLDIYERLLTNTSSSVGSESEKRRPRIEHAQIMRLEDLERTGQLGVIASVQPTHATSDMWYAETRLGPQRIKGAYAYQTLLQSSQKNILPLGSDFPIEGINPLLGFYAAVSRLDVRGNSPHASKGWYSNEKLTRVQALKGMTLDAAYASFAEHEIGSLEEGKKADFVVLDRNILDENLVGYSEVLETKVMMTVVDGKIAFGGL